MKIYELKQTQFLPVNIAAAWEFFANPKNLDLMTPPWLKFEITSSVDEKMFSGQIITYKITTLFGIPQTWVTEIKEVKEPNYFIDEQRFGPYKFWHHKHILKETEGGAELIDLVHYALPFGWIGRMVHQFVVKNKLKKIFEFRYAFLEKKFGSD